jgi:alkanesulfonate monooxygenase SsuD/methylene tetrahydromethanopterin reductase-like flavin-dependent oxidoreductase (luciferase family)
MAFEFGVFHEFQRRPGQSEAEAFTTAFEQVNAAERWGLDAIWLAEIHMAPERSVCAAPLTIASAIAARTKNIKVGLGVQVLPLCQPLRLAEEAATVDHISRGRLLFGVGRSGFPRAYEAYGISYGESTERFAEVLVRPGKPPGTRAMAKSICALRSMSATPSSRRSPTRKRR